MENYNIHYQTPQLAKFYRNHRIAWPDLYESEKKVLTKINFQNNKKLLDIGCGCGGLGLILREKFNFINYTGIEINEESANLAKVNNPNASIIVGDFLELNLRKFNIVVSLSCIDWNVEFNKMFDKAWDLVDEGGEFLISLRLTDKKSLLSIENSFQYINFEQNKEGEIAPYIVINSQEIIEMIKGLNKISQIFAYGYFSPPAFTAVTSLNEICFAVFLLKKSEEETNEIKINLELPEEIKLGI